MDNQQNIPKGELMEELLRNYFLGLGYYVVRSVKYRYEDNDITDIDLYLYGRSSSLVRLRTNVDIKNKKSPQAFERILWANGLKNLLGFDSCIVATTDNRPVIQTFGQLHKTIILDGTFLSKIRSFSNSERLVEEDLLSKFSLCKCNKDFSYKDWRYVYELSKSKLLTELDFSGFNEDVNILKHVIEKIITDELNREISIRMLYLIISHLLIIIDFIVKDIVFLDVPIREKKLSDGFKYGNLGKEGVDKIISIAVKISNSKSVNSLLKSIDSIPTDILKDFFCKTDNTKNLFNWAKEFEKAAFNKQLSSPENVESQLKGVLSLFLDYFEIERKVFFNLFCPSSE